MPEFLTRISNQLTEFWNKFTNKQKIQMIATVAIAIIALVVLVVILNRPNYVLLQGDIEPGDVNKIVSSLEAAGIENQVGDDTRSVYVLAGDKSNATLALASDGILTSDEMSLSTLFDNSIMTTDAERSIKYQEFAESELAKSIEMIDVIDDAQVELVMPDMDTTILDDVRQAKASIIVTSNGQVEDSIVESIAKFVATSVDNLELSNVTVIDSVGRLLFDGESVSDNMNNISSKVEYEMQKELVVKNNVRSILLSAGEYDDANVTVDLVIDFDELQRVTTTHTTQDGTNAGIIDSDSTYTEESTNTGATGAPGTDVNGVTDTMVADGGESTVTIEERNVTYTYDTDVATAVKAIGGVLYDQSTVTVSLTKYTTYNQEILENQADGPLQDTTWDEFKYNIESQGRTKIENIDQDIVDMVRMASNVDNVIVVAYEAPKFIDKPVQTTNVRDYVLIGIIVGMILLLGYAVYKGTEPVEIQETEPELSVEDMLATTKDKTELESIEFDGKSDARVQIESFVDNNPDAVALLLRNWLNEDWE